MANQEIRQAATVSGVRLWQIAERLGIADCNFSRKLRHELSPEERDRVLNIIQELSRREVME